MKVAIIGAGFAGLSAAYYLSKKKDVEISVFEEENEPGGLAVGFENPKWEWPLEKHYHHWFTNDDAILGLAKELNYRVEIIRPKTSTFIDGDIYQLDSPLSLLTFSKLSIASRLRTGFVLAFLKLTPNWKHLEGITAERFLKKWNGEQAWEVLWRPLFEKKFSNYASEIPASWFWARIKKRTPSLAYPEKGFLTFAQKLSTTLINNGVKMIYQNRVSSLSKKANKFEISVESKTYRFDKVICTLPSPLFVKMVKGLPLDYIESLINLKGIGAINLILSLNKQFLSDGTYWLNINASHFPFLALVEHTNFVDSKHYANEHLLYIGNYLPREHEYFKKETTDLVKDFYPFLKTINPKFVRSWINSAYLFKVPFAQPIIPLNYSKILPSLETPVDGLYLANIQQVYPWDRGTNYAVELGEKVAKLVIKSQ